MSNFEVCIYVGAVVVYIVAMGSVHSGQGHIMISILIDLHDFWTYENREVLVTDMKDPTTLAAMQSVDASQLSE